MLPLRCASADLQMHPVLRFVAVCWCSFAEIRRLETNLSREHSFSMGRIFKYCLVTLRLYSFLSRICMRQNDMKPNNNSQMDFNVEQQKRRLCFCFCFVLYKVKWHFGNVKKCACGIHGAEYQRTSRLAVLPGISQRKCHRRKHRILNGYPQEFARVIHICGDSSHFHIAAHEKYSCV